MDVQRNTLQEAASNIVEKHCTTHTEKRYTREEARENADSWKTLSTFTIYGGCTVRKLQRAVSGLTDHGFVASTDVNGKATHIVVKIHSESIEEYSDD